MNVVNVRNSARWHRNVITTLSLEDSRRNAAVNGAFRMCSAKLLGHRGSRSALL